MTVSIPLEEQFGPDNPFLIQKESSWIRDSFQKWVIGHFFVFDSKGSDYLALGVGEKRKGDFPFLGESRENFYLVVTNTNDLDLGGFQFLDVLLQLNQLLNAKRSPAGGTIENQGHLISFVEKFF